MSRATPASRAAVSAPEKQALYALQLINIAEQFTDSDPEMFVKLVTAAMVKHGRPALDAAGLLPMNPKELLP